MLSLDTEIRSAFVVDNFFVGVGKGKEHFWPVFRLPYIELFCDFTNVVLVLMLCAWQEKPGGDGGARPKQKVQKSASIATDMDHSAHPAADRDQVVIPFNCLC